MDKKGIEEYFRKNSKEIGIRESIIYILDITVDVFFETYYTVHYFYMDDGGCKFKGQYGISVEDFREFKLNKILD